MARLFFALQPSLAERQRLESLVPAQLARAGRRPINASNFHLTLYFLGETDESATPALLSLLPRLERPLRLVLDRLDYWARQHVLCALPAEDENCHRAAMLAGALRESAGQAALATDALPFRPHVTLLRGLGPAALRTEHWPQPLAEPTAWDCDRVLLMRSDPGPDGPAYRIVRD